MQNIKNIISGYIPTLDITVIFEELTTTNNKPLQTTLISYYYGEPTEELTQLYYKKDSKHNKKAVAKYNLK